MRKSTNREYLEAWNRDGFFVIPKVISDEKCEQLKKEGLEIIQKYAPPGNTVYLGCSGVSENFAALAQHPTIIEALKLVMPDGIEFLSDKIVYKKPGKAFATPWHIDAWYWKNTRPKISIWIPFEDTSAQNGTLTVLPGSHRRTWKPLRRGQEANEFVNILDGEDPTLNEIHVCELQRGSAVIFSDLLLHGSTPSLGDNERHAIISTYHAPGEEPFDLNFKFRRLLYAPGC